MRQQSDKEALRKQAFRKQHLCQGSRRIHGSACQCFLALRSVLPAALSRRVLLKRRSRGLLWPLAFLGLTATSTTLAEEPLSRGLIVLEHSRIKRATMPDGGLIARGNGVAWRLGYARHPRRNVRRLFYIERRRLTLPVPSARESNKRLAQRVQGVASGISIARRLPLDAHFKPWLGASIEWYQFTVSQRFIVGADGFLSQRLPDYKDRDGAVSLYLGHELLKKRLNLKLSYQHALGAQSRHFAIGLSYQYRFNA